MLEPLESRARENLTGGLETGKRSIKGLMGFWMRLLRVAGRARERWSSGRKGRAPTSGPGRAAARCVRESRFDYAQPTYCQICYRLTFELDISSPDDISGRLPLTTHLEAMLGRLTPRKAGELRQPARAKRGASDSASEPACSASLFLPNLHAFLPFPLSCLRPSSFTMLAAFALSALAAFSAVQAAPNPTSPDGSTVVNVGAPITAIWEKDAVGNWTDMTIQVR